MGTRPSRTPRELIGIGTSFGHLLQFVQDGCREATGIFAPL